MLTLVVGDFSDLPLFSFQALGKVFSLLLFSPLTELVVGGLFAAGAVETKLGKNRTEAEVRRFTEEKERLEKEKDEIRAQLTQLRKERRELKEMLGGSTGREGKVGCVEMSQGGALEKEEAMNLALLGPEEMGGTWGFEPNHITHTALEQEPQPSWDKTRGKCTGHALIPPPLRSSPGSQQAPRFLFLQTRA